MADEEVDLQNDIETSAFLTFFALDINERNIVTSKSILYSGSTSDFFTKNIAAVIAECLKNNILNSVRDAQYDTIWSIFMKWTSFYRRDCCEIILRHQDSGNSLGALSDSVVYSCYSTFYDSICDECESSVEIIDSKKAIDRANGAILEKYESIIDAISALELINEFDTKLTKIETYSAIRRAAQDYIIKHNITPLKPHEYIKFVPFHDVEDMILFERSQINGLCI